ncbi:transcriptional regulator [Actinokineospora bangkokensis]|uniref:Transcriptional regulator n=2 Tax=Actinokineospora bangkokensis TaxID=1193682 RepID=A0A1Q9LFH2_9PSEU|nr:transcriptional regulator [Actinokineospora bangkokensis]
MITVERHGVHIEQCQGCRGIFLDHGELEAMSTAETRHYGAPAAYQPGPAYPPQGGHYPPQGGHYPPPQQQYYRDSPPGYRDSPPGYGHRAGYRDSPPGYGHHGHKRRKSFLEDLFD